MSKAQAQRSLRRFFYSGFERPVAKFSWRPFLYRIEGTMKYVAIIMMINGAFGVSPPMHYGECVAFIYQLQTNKSTKKDVESAECRQFHKEGDITFYIPAILSQ